MVGWQLLTPSYVPQLTPALIQPILQYPSPSPPPNHYQLLLKELIDAAGVKRRPAKVVPFVTEDNSDSEGSTGEKEEEEESRHAPFTGHMTSRHMRSGLLHTLTETVASEIIFKSLLRQLLEDQEVTTGHTSSSTGHTSIDEVISGGVKTDATTDHDREPGHINITDDGGIAMDTILAGSSAIDGTVMANSIAEYMLRGEHMGMHIPVIMETV